MSIEADRKHYVYGYSDSVKKLQRGRTLETYGEFIKPYLKPGMRVLDCGCGLGSMTLGFAKAVAPGEAIGIDISETMLEHAREDAKADNISNVQFQAASVLDLPFPDNSFDLVYIQTVLAHLKDPLPAIKEMKRVAKKGGIVACKDAYFSGWRVYPHDPDLLEYITYRMKHISDNGGDLDVGIKLGVLFHQVGFSQIDFKMNCSNRDPVAAAKFFQTEIMGFEPTKRNLAAGTITMETLQRYQKAWGEWGKTPGAWTGMMYGEMIGVK